MGKDKTYKIAVIPDSMGRRLCEGLKLETT